MLESGVGEAIERAGDEAERLRMAGEFKRLVLPGEMGERFKVLGLTRAFELQLPGLGVSDQTGRL
jgi:SAM-dependent MidA family methyltransferase